MAQENLCPTIAITELSKGIQRLRVTLPCFQENVREASTTSENRLLTRLPVGRSVLAELDGAT